MNYIGSKYSLIEDISSLISKNVPLQGRALDLFSGTTTVAQQLKMLGYETYANDWQYYSFVTANSYLRYESYPAFERLLSQTKIQQLYLDSGQGATDIFGRNTQSFLVHSVQNRKRISSTEPVFAVLWYLQNLAGKEGPFYHQYCEGGNKGRQYYNKANGLKIQAIGDQITVWSDKGWLSPDEVHWLRASLVESADRIANTASVYGAYLKKVKKSAAKPLEMVALAPVRSPKQGLHHRAFCCDASTVFAEQNLPPMTLTYLDPPYNSRQYSGNYHILETIARWDVEDFTPRGVTGLRDASSQSSPFCSKTKVYGAFDSLFASLNTQFILFSYNNEGLISEEQLRVLFEKHCQKTEFFKLNYGRFRADNDSEKRKYSGDQVQEFLILGTKEVEHEK